MSVNAERNSLRFPLEGHESLLRVFRQEIAQVLEQADALAWTGRRSYRHPNGFEKIVLASDLPGAEELRIHRWCNDAEDTNIHSHAWDFQSYILKGCLEHHCWQLCSGDEITAFLVPPVRLSNGFVDGYDFEELGRYGLEALGVFRLVPGSFYRMNSGILHRVKASGNAISLMVQANFHRSASIVVGNTETYRASSRVGPLDAEEIALVLTETLQTINHADV